MSTIKQDRIDLEKLLNGIDPIAPPVNANSGSAPNNVQTTSGIVDNTSDTNLPEEKIFEFDYDAVKKAQRKKARKTIMNITKHILTDELLEEEYVKDKIEQDIETLADLYMQVETNNIMQRSILSTVSRGNTMPRLYEVFGQMTDKIQAVNKQIINTEQTLRKTYIDLKFEIRDKREEELALAGGKSDNSLGAPQQTNNNIITSNRQLIEQAKERHKKMKLDDIKETSYIEE